jgi:hypothetical protein
MHYLTDLIISALITIPSSVLANWIFYRMQKSKKSKCGNLKLQNCISFIFKRYDRLLISMITLCTFTVIPYVHGVASASNSSYLYNGDIVINWGFILFIWVFGIISTRASFVYPVQQHFPVKRKLTHYD